MNPKSTQPPLGIIEGFYGPPWTWEEREAVVRRLAPHGYGFYWYAPKSDPFLRRRWNELHPRTEAENLSHFAGYCENLGIGFGVGLSPYEIYRSFDANAKQLLKDKLAHLRDLGVNRLALLFDDMPGDLPKLAERQAEVVDWVQAEGRFKHLAVCPTYYTWDPVLDRVFTPRPAGYLKRLGELLHDDIDVFWTGEEVCSRAISPGHVRAIREELGRPVLLWDNYPVNDGDRMSQHLHLRGFTGRPASLAGQVRGHAINPALQPTLTCIAAITLAESYRLGDDYCYMAATRKAATEVLGTRLGSQVCDDILLLEDAGLRRLSSEKQKILRERYGRINHAGAREILNWLDGRYQVTDEMVQTQ
ncbi:beta-N-acetylglucosaminidase domain-containing protein [Marinobacter sp.]|uniref:beta-N-acetylglucosaminidase domain-containing protein n=1 Tax=Marinobacter sp. TaxID=50741 RepID=UPI00385056E5